MSFNTIKSLFVIFISRCRSTIIDSTFCWDGTIYALYKVSLLIRFWLSRWLSSMSIVMTYKLCLELLWYVMAAFWELALMKEELVTLNMESFYGEVNLWLERVTSLTVIWVEFMAFIPLFVSFLLERALNDRFLLPNFFTEIPPLGLETPMGLGSDYLRIFMFAAGTDITFDLIGDNCLLFFLFCLRMARSAIVFICWKGLRDYYVWPMKLAAS